MSQDKANNEAASASQSSTAGAEEPREPAPAHNLPTWGECEMRVSNSDFFAKSVAEGGHGPEADSKLATQLHRFIYEYDDADSYGSAWFLHRLELVIEEAKSTAHVARQRQESPSAAAVDSALKDAVMYGTGMYITKPDGSAEHVSPEKFRAAVAEGVDTAELADIFRALRQAWSHDSTQAAEQRARNYIAQQREAGRLEGISIGRGQAVRDYVNLNDAALAVDRARQPVSEGLTEAAVIEMFKAAGLPVQWLGEASKPFTNGSIALADIARALAAPPAKAEGMSERDAARFLFEHSNQPFMLDIELQVIAGNAFRHIDWWRARIDAAILAQQAKDGAA